MIAIAGYGSVGHAVANKFKQHMEIVVVDPKLGPETVANYTDVIGVVICVNTPESSDGSCDYSRIVSVLETVSPEIPVVIKSAVDIDGVISIQKQFPEHAITYSPEFLRQNTADEDFKNQDFVILGGGDQDFWKRVWNIAFPNIECYLISDIEASIVKYAENSYLATKVSFFNQLYDLCETVGADFSNVRESVCRDSRINSDHSYVTEQRGWGGHCFPKDTAAMVKLCRDRNVPFTLIEEAIAYNKQIRKQGPEL